MYFYQTKLWKNVGNSVDSVENISIIEEKQTS